jgi:hypothetical protein
MTVAPFRYATRVGYFDGGCLRIGPRRDSSRVCTVHALIQSRPNFRDRFPRDVYGPALESFTLLDSFSVSYTMVLAADVILSWALNERAYAGRGVYLDAPSDPTRAEWYRMRETSIAALLSAAESRLK